jgi:hypothetical protein
MISAEMKTAKPGAPINEQEFEMKLPKQLEKEGVEPDVRAALEAECISLPGASGGYIPVLKLTPKLRTNIFHAKSLGDLIIGYEAMAKALTNELRGLRKTGSLVDRVSRLLMATNDGSPNFYRQLAFLQERQGPRLLICRLDVDSLLMGDILGFKDQVVKAVLVNKKKSVANVLKSLLSNSGDLNSEMIFKDR